MKLKSIFTVLGVFGILLVNAQTVTTIGTTTDTPSGIAVDSNGDVYVAERSPTSVITKIAQPSGAMTTYKTLGSSIDVLKILFNSSNDLFLADYSGSILYIPAGGGPLQNYVTGASNPAGMTFDGDTLYFIDYVSQKIYKVLPGGGAVGSANVQELALPSMWMGTGARGAGLSTLGSNHIMVTAGINPNIFRIHKQTLVIDTIAESFTEDVHFDAVMLSDGNYYLTGFTSNKIYSIDTISNNYSLFLGNGNYASVDGQDTSVSFAEPYFIAKDNSDNLYVTDANTQKVRKITNVINSILENEEDLFSYYPNPASEQMNLLFEKNTSFQIISMNGEIVKAFKGESRYEIDVSDLNRGLYVIKSDNGTTKRFIKQ